MSIKHKTIQCQHD